MSFPRSAAWKASASVQEPQPFYSGELLISHGWETRICPAAWARGWLDAQMRWAGLVIWPAHGCCRSSSLLADKCHVELEEPTINRGFHDMPSSLSAVTHHFQSERLMQVNYWTARGQCVTECQMECIDLLLYLTSLCAGSELQQTGPNLNLAGTSSLDVYQLLEANVFPLLIWWFDLNIDSLTKSDNVNIYVDCVTENTRSPIRIIKFRCEKLWSLLLKTIITAKWW